MDGFFSPKETFLFFLIALEEKFPLPDQNIPPANWGNVSLLAEVLKVQRREIFTEVLSLRISTIVSDKFFC